MSATTARGELPDRTFDAVVHLAALVGWRVVRLGPNELTTEHVARLTCLLRQSSASEERVSADSH